MYTDSTDSSGSCGLMRQRVTTWQAAHRTFLKPSNGVETYLLGSADLPWEIKLVVPNLMMRRLGAAWILSCAGNSTVTQGVFSWYDSWDDLGLRSQAQLGRETCGFWGSLAGYHDDSTSQWSNVPLSDCDFVFLHFHSLFLTVHASKLAESGQFILLLSVLVCSCDCPCNVGVFPCGIQVSGQAGGGSFKIETLIV